MVEPPRRLQRTSSSHHYSHSINIAKRFNEMFPNSKIAVFLSSYYHGEFANIQYLLFSNHEYVTKEIQCSRHEKHEESIAKNEPSEVICVGKYSNGTFPYILQWRGATVRLQLQI